jgi:hypothetical protein
MLTGMSRSVGIARTIGAGVKFKDVMRRTKAGRIFLHSPLSIIYDKESRAITGLITESRKRSLYAFSSSNLLGPSANMRGKPRAVSDLRTCLGRGAAAPTQRRRNFSGPPFLCVRWS